MEGVGLGEIGSFVEDAKVIVWYICGVIQLGKLARDQPAGWEFPPNGGEK